MKKFGIVSPLSGLRLNFPSILMVEAAMTDAENVRVYNGEILRTKMRFETLSTDTDAPGTLSDEILKYHLHKTFGGEYWLFAFTKDNIYRWDNTNLTWDEFCTPSLTETTEWSVVSFQDSVFATNSQDKILSSDVSTAFNYHDDTSNGIEVATTPTYMTKAAFLATYEGYLFAGDVTEGGSRYARRLRYCAVQDADDWSSTSAGFIDVPGKDNLTGAAEYKDYLVLFKERSIRRLWLTGDELSFANDLVSAEYGCIARDSANYMMDGTLCFLTSDKCLRTIAGVEISRPISTIIKNISDSAIAKVQAFRVDEYQELWWSIPYGLEATANNKIITANKDGAWSSINISTSAFGMFTDTNSYTIDTIPFDTIDTWNWASIDSVAGVSGFRQDLCSGGSGETYLVHESGTDDGETFTGYCEINTDFSSTGDLNTYKRILEIEVIARPAAGDAVTLSYTPEGTENSTTLGTLSFSQDAEFLRSTLPVDIRVRQLKLKLTGNTHFNIVGIIFTYIEDGLV